MRSLCFGAGSVFVGVSWENEDAMCAIVWDLKVKHTITEMALLVGCAER